LLILRGDSNSVQVPLYLLYFCSISFQFSLYTSTPNWFSPGGWEDFQGHGGVFQGHVDQKPMCSFVMYA
jgi:hypothetical protein